MKIYRFAKKMLSSGDRDLLKYRIKLVSRLYKEEGVKAVYSRLQSAYKNNNPGIYAHNPASTDTFNETSINDRSSLIEAWLKTDFKKASLKVNEQSHYVPKALDSLEGVDLPVKVIAYYLPQFHPFKENNEWWGEGFTEWTNVTKARPQYLGHQQPRLPGELGFYDLRLPQVMRQQIDLAKQYGVNGFCFHHYWFGGKRLMETPVQNFLKDKSLDIDFCLCWANENWTRRWDGLENDVLISQKHSPEDDIAFLDDIMPALKDERYIRVDGKPLLILYRASSLPDAKETGKRWREHAIKNGLPGLYLVVVNAFDVSSPQPYDFDAIVEFPPHQIGAKDITDSITPLNKNFTGRVYDYEELALRAGKIDNDNFTCFKAVMPSWDNEARKPTQGFSFYNAKPELYAKWLDSAIKTTMNRRPEERLVFVNAWNEWAEGAHLEPDRHNGYAYLHATANILRNSLLKYDCDNQLISDMNQEFKPRFKSAVILHAYYEDLACELVEKYIAQYQDKLDLIITMRSDVKLSTLEKIKASFKNVFFVMVDNRGRDIRPFIKALKVADGFGYKYICKVHTKKSPHRVDGQQWRESLFADLLGAREHVAKIINYFELHEDVGIIAPRNSITDLSIPEINLGNRYWLEKLFARMDSPELFKTFKTSFPAGSMFWFRKDALDPLASNLLDEEEFELEAGQLDGTLAHSVERVTGAVANSQGFKVVDITSL
ncbi:glycoside hydrolase family 99-like domain-containing protein [Pantoea sp. B550]|uniref:glycoside hydrolase family 99-like domain-containing protein n=1 Tax=Pantoea TaxID=53335 RepID=UPI001CA396D2|nr:MULTISPECIES: glycoside hydrolase family 99-like domain-containing protein [Pantoea]MCP1205023.1 glycoside hydrolase family 99-like domain-containing protein [Pantoea sp. B550]QZX96904.1 glycoside hydrolase family 99-like domain-containing protein [Pantoea alfalfae]